MALFNFQEQFVPFIKDGTKTHTIRAIRKHPQKVGELMHLYWGLRTSDATPIIEPPVCTDVKTILFFDTGMVILVDRVYTKDEAEAMQDKNWLRVIRHETIKILTPMQKDRLAWRDGFRHEIDPIEQEGCFDIMYRWWKITHQLPFIGHINYWK